MKIPRLLTLFLLAGVLLLAAAHPAVAAPATDEPVLVSVELLAVLFSNLLPAEAAPAKAPTGVSAPGPLDPAGPPESASVTPSVAEDSSNSESGALIDPNG